MSKDFDEKNVRVILTQYPSLRVAFKAGLISRRLCRSMINVTKGDMDDLYVDLIRYNAIRVLSSSAFRATDDTLNLISKMDMEDEQIDK